MKALPDGTRLISIFTCILFALPVSAKEYRLKVTLTEDNSAGISLAPSEMSEGFRVQVGDEAHEFGLVVVHGRHTNKQLPLLFEGKPVEVDDRGEFQLRVEIKSEHEELHLTTVEINGKIYSFSAKLDFPEWEEFLTSVLGKQKPTLRTGFNRIQYEMPFGSWTTSNANSSKTVYSVTGLTHSLFLQGGLKLPKRTNQGLGILGNATLTYTIPTSSFTFPLSGSFGVKGLYTCLYDSPFLKISPFLGIQYERITIAAGLITSLLINDGHQIKTGDFGSILGGAIFYLGDPSNPYEITPQISQSFVGQYSLTKQNIVGPYTNTTLQIQVRSSVYFRYFYFGTRGQTSLLQGDVQTPGWLGFLFLGAQLN